MEKTNAAAIPWEAAISKAVIFRVPKGRAPKKLINRPEPQTFKHEFINSFNPLEAPTSALFFPNWYPPWPEVLRVILLSKLLKCSFFLNYKKDTIDGHVFHTSQG